MSLWSAKPLRIALAPGEVALLRSRGTQASRMLTTHEISATSLLPLLDEALADTDWHQRQVEVVLSQHFVRHVLTPPPGKVLSRSEEHALAAASLNSIYGEEAARWRLKIHSQPPHAGLVAAAVDESFAHQLDAILARHGFSDVKIHPLASLAARHLPRQFKGWWALAEPGWLSLFAGANGIWQHVSGQPVDADWAAALPELVEREAGLNSLEAIPNIWVQAIGSCAVSTPDSPKGKWHVLPHNVQAQGALALAGI